MLEILQENKELYIVLISMLPVVELRGAIPIGIALGFTPLKSLLLSIIGNVLIIPVVLGIFKPIMDYLETTSLFKKTIGYIKERTLRKTKDKIHRHKIFGLYLFVALPIPTTGVWTGSLAAALLNMDYKKSFLAMALGVVTSGLIVALLSHSILN